MKVFSLLLCAIAAAHDIPNDATVQAWLRPNGASLDLIVRVPLKAVRDIEIPQRGPGYLDIAHAHKALEDAAQVWIAEFIAARSAVWMCRSSR